MKGISLFFSIFAILVVLISSGHTNLFNRFTDFFQHRGCRVAGKKKSDRGVLFFLDWSTIQTATSFPGLGQSQR